MIKSVKIFMYEIKTQSKAHRKGTCVAFSFCDEQQIGNSMNELLKIDVNILKTFNQTCNIAEMVFLV